MIDCHFHLWTEDESTPEKRAERAEQIRRQMELQGVDRIALIGEVGNTVEECREANRVVAKYVEEHPDLFYGWARVDPRLGEDAVAEFRRAVQEDGLVGLKHHFVTTPTNISDPEFFPLAEAAVEMDVPIIAHVMQRLEQDKENWDDSEAYTEDVMELATRYPELKLITAHIVAGGDPEYRIKNIADQDNVIVDVSGSNTDTQHVEMTAEYCGVDRMVFGTDTWFRPGVGKLVGCDLTPEQKAEIAYGFEDLLSDNVPNRYDEGELEAKKAEAVERFEAAEEPREETIVDANAFVGDWPFRPLDASPEALLDVMDEKGVDKALASSADSVFYRNAQHGNEELAEAVAGHEDRIVPVATINPGYTAWREDLARCDEELGMRAVKLLPAYHYYDLNDPETKALFEACAERDLPVILVATLEDQRLRHPATQLHGYEEGGTRAWTEGHVDALVETLRDCPETDVIIADAWNNAGDIVEQVHEVTPQGVRLDNEVRSGETLFLVGDLFYYFDHQGEDIVEEVGVDHLATGPQLPFKIFESYYNATEQLPVDEDEKDRVRAGNVLSLLD